MQYVPPKRYTPATRCCGAGGQLPVAQEAVQRIVGVDASQKPGAWEAHPHGQRTRTQVPCKPRHNSALLIIVNNFVGCHCIRNILRYLFEEHSRRLKLLHEKDMWQEKTAEKEDGVPAAPLGMEKATSSSARGQTRRYA